jgi:hypothetical protein
MGIQTTGSNPKGLFPGVIGYFGSIYDEHDVEWSQCCEIQQSNKLYEERVQRVGYGLAPVKSQGASISFDEETQGYISRITNVVYAIGGIVTREAIEDDQYESVAMRIARCIAFSIRQTEENVCANAWFNRGFNSSFPGGDGVELYSSAHPEVGGNQSNILSPAADFSEVALEDLLIQIMNAKDSRGQRISLVGEKVIGSTSLAFEMTRVLESQWQSGTANNDLNAIKKMGMVKGGSMANHYITDTDAWFVKTNAPEGLIFQNRRDREFGNDNDFVTENARMKGSRRFGAGHGDWRGSYASPGE